jgi:heme o synthase
MRTRTLALTTAISTFVLMLVGSYVKSIQARYACPDWPLCWGRVLPPFPTHTYTTEQIMAEWLHRDLAAIVGVLMLMLAVSLWRHHRQDPAVFRTGMLAGGLLLVQIILGALTVKRSEAIVSVMHMGTAVLFLAALIVLTTLLSRRPPLATTQIPAQEGLIAKAAEAAPPQQTAPRPLGRIVADYVSILKPRILMLLLVSAITTMFIAGGGQLDGALVAWTLLGGAMAAGSGNAFNMYLERDIDALMTRTRNRPIPSGRVPARHVLIYGIVLAVASFGVLASTVNLLAAYLALGGALFYVVVYTLWLKRTRPNNIVIGGAAGSFPVLVGWAAVTNQVSLAALVLGLIVFLWTPPHFWAIALFRREEYARARIPMMPVVRGTLHTNKQILLYTVATLISTTALWMLGVLSDLFLFLAMLLGFIFVWLAFENLRDYSPRRAHKLFRYSIAYLGLVFLAMAVDAVVMGPRLA